MREYALIAPTFWTGETGKKITHKGLETRVLATYLLTNPHATCLGLYYLAIPFIIHETGLSKRDIERSFKELAEAGIEFAFYDYATEFVWVPEMATYQLHYLKPGDNRLKPVLRLWECLPKNPFIAAFFEKYGAKYGFTPKNLQGLAKGLIQGLVTSFTSPQIMDVDVDTDRDKDLKPLAFDFESVWKAYPKKIGKPTAFEKFKKTVKSPEDYATLQKALANYLAYLKRNGTDLKYTKEGRTWFNQWRDWIEYQEETPHARKQSSQLDQLMDQEFRATDEKSPVDDLSGMW